MGTLHTAVRGWPMPAESDVPDVASDIQALANALDIGICKSRSVGGSGVTLSIGDWAVAAPNAGLTLPAPAANGIVVITAATTVTPASPVAIGTSGAASILYGEGLSGASSCALTTGGTSLTVQSDGTNWYVIGSSSRPSHSAGASNITTSQSTSSTSYTTLATPDQVSGIVLPTNGLIRVWYQASWSEIVSGSARAAIFIGGNQLKVGDYDGAPVTTAAATSSTSGNFLPLASCPYGLVSGGGPNAYSGDVTTGQVVGVTTGAYNLNVEYNGSVVHPFSSGQYPPVGGPCDIFAAAGTYTISVQFKVVSGGSISVKNRQLWVQAIPFS